jgi:hypothetical protein
VPECAHAGPLSHRGKRERHAASLHPTKPFSNVAHSEERGKRKEKGGKSKKRKEEDEKMKEERGKRGKDMRRGKMKRKIRERYYIKISTKSSERRKERAYYVLTSSQSRTSEEREQKREPRVMVSKRAERTRRGYRFSRR